MINVTYTNDLGITNELVDANTDGAAFLDFGGLGLLLAGRGLLGGLFSLLAAAGGQAQNHDHGQQERNKLLHFHLLLTFLSIREGGKIPFTIKTLPLFL